MAFEPNRLDLTDDPIVIALRRHMKGQFLYYLDLMAKDHLHDDSIRMVIYGSTLMRELVESFGAKLPFPGIKSSDIDIGAYQKTGYHLNPSEEVYLEKVCPVLQKAIYESGFNLKRAQNKLQTSFRVTENPEIMELELPYFTNDYYLTYSFAPGEVEHLLRPQWQELSPHFQSGKDVEVHLSISSHQRHFPIIMKPIPMYSRLDDGEESKLRRADRYDMLAGKIARSLTPSFKPTDLIDIYNLYHGTIDSGRPILEIGQREDVRDHSSVLRLLVLHYIMMSNSALPNLESPDLFRHVQPNEANYRVFEQVVREQISSHRQEELLSRKLEIFGTNMWLIGRIFPEGPANEKRYGVLNLRKEEVEYVLSYYGRSWPEQKSENKGSATSGIANLFGSLFSRGLKPLHTAVEKQLVHTGIFQDAGYVRTDFGQLDCKMNLEKIRPLYAHADALYPDIFRNLGRHDLLQGLMQERIFGAPTSEFGIE